ncbi:MAG TPA: enoyl-CoA hydratase-related protein [Pseudonocardiaceae bacterium]|nr:enoyl-CoA hydratase-related protein [Pseudonocardiaceae bacterium]
MTELARASDNTAGPIRVEVGDGVGAIHLEAPNILTPDMMEHVAGTLDEFDRGGDVRVAVVAGRVDVFLIGSDVRAMRERTFAETLDHPSARFWPRLAALGLPVIAAVSGNALGGGCELALACDLIVASDTARFAQPEIRLGIMPGGGGTQRLAHVLGKARTMDMVLTGRRVTAAEALSWGLVNRVVPPAECVAEALRLAAELAAAPPIALRLAKRAVLAAGDTPLTAGLSLERRLYELAMATDDRVEGMTALLEHRDPIWRGR